MNITAGSWLFDGNILLFWYPDQSIVSDSYKGRISLNLSTSQITLYSAQVSDSGLYVLQGMNPIVKAELLLSVQGEFPNTHNQTHFTNSFNMLYQGNWGGGIQFISLINNQVSYIWEITWLYCTLEWTNIANVEIAQGSAGLGWGSVFMGSLIGNPTLLIVTSCVHLVCSICPDISDT